MLPLFYVIMVRRSSRGVYRGVHRPAPGYGAAGARLGRAVHRYSSRQRGVQYKNK